MSPFICRHTKIYTLYVEEEVILEFIQEENNRSMLLTSNITKIYKSTIWCNAEKK